MANIQIQNKIEEILDKVAVALLTSDYYGDTQKVKQNQKTIRDSSGNLNPGIIIGDYSVKKDKIGEPATRDSFIQTPKVGSDKGAF